VNQNQGAESTLAFLMALVEMRLVQEEPSNSLFADDIGETLIAVRE